MGFLTQLAEEMGANLRMVADVWLVEWSKRLTEELEKARDEETQERLREYKEDIRDIALGIHQLLAELSFDEMVDPEVGERLRVSSSTKIKGNG